MSVKTDLTKVQCAKCLLDTSMGGVVIEDNGQCNFCNNYHAYYKSILAIDNKEAALKRQIDQIKRDGKNLEYDCILGLSGGVDSSYMAYMAKNVWGLRPLGVHLDNGWNDELAVGNIEKICKQLDIDLFTYVIDWQEFRDIQVAFLKASVENAEAPTDHAIFATLFQLASKYGIKHIIDGTNHQTEYNRVGFLPGGYTYSDWKQIEGIHAQFGKIPLKTFPRLQFWKRFYYSMVKGINRVALLNLIDYNKADAMALLQEKLGWTPYSGKHHESLFTKWNQCVYLRCKFGYDKRAIHLSDLILSNQMTRDDAQQRYSQAPISETERKELEAYVTKKLGLTTQEYEQILSDKPRLYIDYPNNNGLIQAYMKLRNKFKKG